MRIHIYYGGRGLIEDSNLYVLSRITEVLEELSPMAQMMQQLNMQAKAYLFDAETLEAAEYYNSLKREVAREGVQAYCPYSFAMN